MKSKILLFSLFIIPFTCLSQSNTVSTSDSSNNQPEKSYSAYTPINKNNEVLSYQKFEALRIGMKKNQVKLILGEPLEIYRTILGKKDVVSWQYSLARKGRSYLEFKNGKLYTINFPSRYGDYDE